MKKSVVLLMVILSCFVNFVYADINIDLSGSTVGISNSNTIKMDNVVVPGIAGKYWVTFQWDPRNLVFVPAAVGQETAPTGASWSWSVWNGFSSNEGGYSYIFNMTSDPANRVIYVSFTAPTGEKPFICPGSLDGPTFIQGNQFDVVECLSGCVASVDNAHALITYTAFGGCAYIYAGQTVTATISHIPQWFDFSKAFEVGFGSNQVCYNQPLTCSNGAMTCNPDGSIHE